MRICLILLLDLVPFILLAQSVRSPVSAPYIGMGAYSVTHVDAFSITSNQAALAQIKNQAIGVYGERRFMLDATNMYSSIVAIPTEKGNFAFEVDYFGFKNFNESQVGLAYARSLGSNIDIGIKFNYYSFRIPTYHSSSTFNFEIGAIVHFSEQLHAGIHFYNPVGGILSKTENEKLSSIYTFGLGYEPSQSFFLSTEIVKEEGLPVNVNAGVQYNFQKQFFARAGISSYNASPFAGAGVSWSNIRLDLSASYHPQLGISPGLMFILNLKSAEGGKD